MKEFLSRREAYVLGQDCRAYPPTSLTPCHADASRRTTTGAVDTSGQVTSPGDHGNRQRQVRGGPWRTPDALGGPPAAGLSPSTVMGPGGRYGAYRVTAPWRQTDRDGVRQLNVSMNRAATSDDIQPPTAGTEHVTSSASDCQSSSSSLTTVVDQPRHTAVVTTSSRDTQLKSSSTSWTTVQLEQARPMTSRLVDGPLTSTPLDYSAPPNN